MRSSGERRERFFERDRGQYACQLQLSVWSSAEFNPLVEAGPCELEEGLEESGEKESSVALAFLPPALNAPP